MTGAQPQHAPGDPVLVAAVVVEGPDWEGDYTVAVVFGQTEDCGVYVRAADVHPVPPTPDPRDQALAAVRALHEEHTVEAWGGGKSWSVCAECSDPENGMSVPFPCATIRALVGVAPVPAPPAPTPTGWRAVRDGDSVLVAHGSGEYFAFPDSTPSAAMTTALALRAEEAAAAAPATTDDDRVTRAVLLLDRFVERALDADFHPATLALLPVDALRDLLNAHRAAGSPPPVRSDLTGLGAREAGLTVYPATDARSTDQDVTG